MGVAKGVRRWRLNRPHGRTSIKKIRDRVFYLFFIKKKGQKKGQNMDTKDSQVILGLPRNPKDTNEQQKYTRGDLHLKTPTDYACQRKIHPRNGRQQRVGEAMVAKHPPVVSSASIRKRLGSRCGELSIHPQATR